MPLFALSGLPSRAKNELFGSLVGQIKQEYRVVVVVQNAVGENTQEEVSQLRAVVQNRLRKDVLLAVLAPLHLKSLRYEIFSTAKNMGIEYCQVLHTGQLQGEAALQAGEFPPIEQLEGYEIIEVAPKGPLESLPVLRRIFEPPRRGDKWDCPVFTTGAASLPEGSLGVIRGALQLEQKVRQSCLKIMPQHLDPTYLDRAKEQIKAALEEYRETAPVSLKDAREMEGSFLSVLKAKPQPIASIKKQFAAFILEYLTPNK